MKVQGKSFLAFLAASAFVSKELVHCQAEHF